MAAEGPFGAENNTVAVGEDAECAAVGDRAPLGAVVGVEVDARSDHGADPGLEPAPTDGHWAAH